MENLPKPFIQIGAHLINMNAVAFILKLSNGAVRITTTVTRKDGSPHAFVIPQGEHAAEFMRQIDPYIALHAADVPVEGGEID